MLLNILTALSRYDYNHNDFLYEFSDAINRLNFLSFSTSFISSSIAIFTIVVLCIYASKRGIKNWWLAIFPIGQEYLLGSLADEYHNKKARKKFMGISIAYYISFAVFFIVFIVAFSIFIFDVIYNMEKYFYYNGDYGSNFMPSTTSLIIFFIALLLFLGILIAYITYSVFVQYRIFASKDRQHATLWTVGSFFIPIIFPIFLLINMNKQGADINGVPIINPVNAPPPAQGGYYNNPSAGNYNTPYQHPPQQAYHPTVDPQQNYQVTNQGTVPNQNDTNSSEQ